MDRLWSPWRYSYIAGPGASPEACIFCQKAAEGRDAENYIVHRAHKNFVMLNLYPYTSGHVMIAPYEHVATLPEAADDTLTEMMLLTRDTERILREVYRAKGINAGLNLGESAGAGVADHIHMHVLPRWPGDVNFMTAIGETRVLPEDLGTTYEKMRRAFGHPA
jgi:ATP adenylyltransferase